MKASYDDYKKFVAIIKGVNSQIDEHVYMRLGIHVATINDVVIYTYRRNGIYVIVGHGVDLHDLASIKINL